MKFFKAIFKAILGLLAAVVLLSLIFYFAYQPPKTIGWGINYSPDYAAYLGFNKKDLYLQILDDLKPKYLRLMVYWEDLEPKQGKFNLAGGDFEFMLQQAQERNVKVILVLGHKQPRWPECHQPPWYESLAPEQQQAAVLGMLESAVGFFKNFPAVEMWQIENEPYFQYGPDCPTIFAAQFKQELALVKSLDSRPIVVTDSGEKGAWLPAAFSGAGVFGSTLYRTVYLDKQKRYLTYPIPPLFYRVRAGMNRLLTPIKRTLGVELQAEPWFNGTVYSIPWIQQSQLMNPGIFYANINYARQAGLEREYLWGVEWWAWAKSQGHGEMWDAAKQFYNDL